MNREMRKKVKLIEKGHRNTEHNNKNLEWECDKIKRKVETLKNIKIKREGYYINI